MALEGHSASGGNHDIGVNSLLWHIILAALWIGGLASLIAHAARKGPHLARLVRRYSTLALICITGIAASGVVNAAVRLDFTEWFTTDYGRIVALKAALTILLAAIGLRHRQSTLPALESSPPPRPSGSPTRRHPFVRLAVVELVIMAATVGVAVSLSRIPPPVEYNADITQAEMVLGFAVTAPFSLSEVMTNWRFDLVFGVAALILQLGYLWAWQNIRHRGLTWPAHRVLWWSLGNLVLIVATCSGLGRYAMALFTPHMIQHILLSIVIPLLWVAAAPVTLLRTTLPSTAPVGGLSDTSGPGYPGLPDASQWLTWLTDNPVTRCLTHPVVVVFQFAGVFFGVYFTGLFDVLTAEHAGHVGLVAMFLLSGVLFFWSFISKNSPPRRLGTKSQCSIGLAATVIHIAASTALMQIDPPIAAEYYISLQLPFPVDLAQQQYTASLVSSWIGGGILALVSAACIIGALRQRSTTEPRPAHDTSSTVTPRVN